MYLYGGTEFSSINRRTVILGHNKTFFGTHFHACTAGDAAEMFDLPHLVFPVDFDCVGGTFFRTDGTMNAFGKINRNVTACRFKRYALFKRIHERCGLFEKVKEGRSPHMKVRHNLPLGAADTWVDSKDDVRNVGQI